MFFPRSDWEVPGKTISGPAINRALVSSITVHYPGGNTGPLDTVERQRDYLRRMQADYLTSRGYSLGYSWVVMPDGNVWESRGLLYRNAADGSSSWNLHGVSIQFATPTINTPLTAAQINAARWLYAEVSHACGRDLTYVAHGAVRNQVWPAQALDGQWQTACPGQAVWAQHLLLYPPLEPPVPEPIPTEEPMRVVVFEWEGDKSAAYAVAGLDCRAVPVIDGYDCLPSVLLACDQTAPDVWHSPVARVLTLHGDPSTAGDLALLPGHFAAHVP